ncbi:MAG: CheR family methyltransferase [Desulfitobacteriaceae bacterium]
MIEIKFEKPLYTSFFREPMEWELLKDKVIPALLAERAPSNTLRVWVSGCATGDKYLKYGKMKGWTKAVPIYREPVA